MMKHLLCTTVIVFALLAVIFFPMSSQSPLTFTAAVQNPDATAEKYADVWDSTEIRQGNRACADFDDGEEVASVTIPSLDIYELPVYYGSKGLNSDWQITAPGYNEGWGMFGDEKPAAIGSHNYQMFSSLPDIKTGDRLIVETSADTYVYQVTDKFIYSDATDSWADTVSAAEDHSLVLMTCYPIDSSASEDRYIVYTKLLKGTIY